MFIQITTIISKIYLIVKYLIKSVSAKFLGGGGNYIDIPRLPEGKTRPKVINRDIKYNDKFVKAVRR